jgi:hypothetical protein
VPGGSTLKIETAFLSPLILYSVFVVPPWVELCGFMKDFPRLDWQSPLTINMDFGYVFEQVCGKETAGALSAHYSEIQKAEEPNIKVLRTARSFNSVSKATNSSRYRLCASLLRFVAQVFLRYALFSRQIPLVRLALLQVPEPQI